MRARAYTSQRLRREGWVGPPANSAACRGLQQALAALRGDGASLEGDAALAAMEQARLDAERDRTRQPSLALRVVP